MNDAAAIAIWYYACMRNAYIVGMVTVNNAQYPRNSPKDSKSTLIESLFDLHNNNNNNSHSCYFRLYSDFW